METLKILLSSSWFGNAVSIMSIIAAIYFYVKSKATTILAHQCESSVIIDRDDKSSELEVRYLGNVVSRVTRERIVIWNHGNQTIAGGSISTKDPLIISIGGEGEILRINIEKTTREVISPEFTKINEKSISMKFEFLDPDDGVAIEIIHSGYPGSIRLNGTIRGCQKSWIKFGLKGKVIREVSAMNKLYEKYFFPTAFALGGIMGISGFLLKEYPQIAIKEDAKTPGVDIMLISIGLFYTIGAGLFLWLGRRRHPRSLT